MCKKTDRVNVWPHLLVVEFVASLAMTAFLLVFSTFVNAPLLGQANFNPVSYTHLTLPTT